MTIFDEEVKYKISKNRADTNPDNLVNKKTIEKILEKGQEITPFLMKNLFVSYKINNQLQKYEEKWNIEPEQMFAAEGYRKDYEVNGTVSYSQSKYDGATSSPMNSGNRRDVAQYQIDASRRITKVKMHFKGNNQRYKLVEMFVGDDISLRAIEKRMKMDTRTIKKRLMEGLEVLTRVYKCV